MARWSLTRIAFCRVKQAFRFSNLSFDLFRLAFVCLPGPPQDIAGVFSAMMPFLLERWRCDRFFRRRDYRFWRRCACRCSCSSNNEAFQPQQPAVHFPRPNVSPTYFCQVVRFMGSCSGFGDAESAGQEIAKGVGKTPNTSAALLAAPLCHPILKLPCRQQADLPH